MIFDRINVQAEINRQKNARNEAPKIQQLSAQPKPPEVISVDELRKVLESMENELPKLQEAAEGATISFNNVEGFCEWMIPHLESFEENEKKVLAKVIEIRDAIFKGCACKRGARRGMANSLFETFITENQNSPLINQIKNISKATKIKFFNGDRLYLEK